MRIALIGRWKPDAPGGPDNVLISLAREFVKAGHTVAVWWPRGSCKAVRHSEPEPGISVTELPPAGPLPFLRPETRRFLVEQSATCDAAMLFSVFMPFNNAAARALRCPYVVAPLGGYGRESTRRRKPLLKKLYLALFERRYLLRALSVNVWSENEKSEVAEIADIRNYLITPPGFVGELSPPHPGPVAEKGRRILFLGRFAVDHKGLDRLIASFSRVSGPDDVLTIAGADFRGGLEVLQRLAETSGGAGKIVFEGPAWGESKAALFARHDVFTHYSRWEGLPLAVVEALAAGLPCLVTEETNVGEYLRKSSAGWVVTNGDFDQAMKDSLTVSPEQLATMSTNAGILVKTVFRWDTAANDLIRTFEGGMKRDPATR